MDNEKDVVEETTEIVDDIIESEVVNPKELEDTNNQEPIQISPEAMMGGMGYGLESVLTSNNGASKEALQAVAAVAERVAEETDELKNSFQIHEDAIMNIYNMIIENKNRIKILTIINIILAILVLILFIIK